MLDHPILANWHEVDDGRYRGSSVGGEPQTTLQERNLLQCVHSQKQTVHTH